MAHTNSSLNVHAVFSTKNRLPVITAQMRGRLWAFMGGIARKNRLLPLCIGGVEDHVHLLLTLPTTVTVAKAIQQIKGGSSAWARDTFPNSRGFAWQEGYGAFSVSQSHIKQTITYIGRQETHHQKKSFQEEYLAFLAKHEIAYDERYLWD
jgi:REP element-mobilizing transposase RayT